MNITKDLTVSITGNLGTPTYNWTNDMGLVILNGNQNPAQLELNNENFYEGNITCQVADDFCNQELVVPLEFCPNITISDYSYCSELEPPLPPPLDNTYYAIYTKIKFRISGFHPIYNDYLRINLAVFQNPSSFFQKVLFDHTLTPITTPGVTATMTYIAGSTYEVHITIDGLEGTDGFDTGGSGPVSPGGHHMLQIEAENNCESITNQQSLDIHRTANCDTPPF